MPPALTLSNPPVKHFNDIAVAYDSLAFTIHPRYSEMLNQLSERLSIRDRSCPILDLGCGTGNLTVSLNALFPDVRFVCADGSPTMLTIARTKLHQQHIHARFIERLIENVDFGSNQFCGVASSLALHHIQGYKERVNLFSRIHRAICPGGSFWIADITKCSQNRHTSQDLRNWIDFMRSSGHSSRQVDSIGTASKQHDTPARLIDELRALEEAGFEKIDCTWRYMGYTVYGGVKT